MKNLIKLIESLFAEKTELEIWAQKMEEEAGL